MSKRRKKKSLSRRKSGFWRCSLRVPRIRSAGDRKAHCRFECAGGWGDGRAGRRGARRSSEERARRCRHVRRRFTISKLRCTISPSSGHCAGRSASMIRCCIPICSIRPTRRIRCLRLRCGDSILKLSGNLAEAADVTGRLASALRKEVDEQGLTSVYEEIDAPLVPVLARMEDAGVKIDPGGAGRDVGEVAARGRSQGARHL